jgi:hypothetical protein
VITAAALLVFALLCLYAGGRQAQRLGDERLSQLSRGALRPIEWDRVMGALLLMGCGAGFALAALLALGWLPHG